MIDNPEKSVDDFVVVCDRPPTPTWTPYVFQYVEADKPAYTYMQLNPDGSVHFDFPFICRICDANPMAPDMPNSGALIMHFALAMIQKNWASVPQTTPL